VNESLALLKLLTGDGKRIVIVLEAFLDESGTHRNAPVLSVAGYAGSHDQWKTFLSIWGNRKFHAKEPTSRKLKPLLWKAIKESQVQGIATWISPEDFEKHASPQFKTLLGNAYSLCTFMSALRLCSWAKEEELGPVAFTIEGGQPNVERIRKVLEFLQHDEGFNIAHVGVASKDAFRQLYTADFLAHSRTSDPHWWKMLYQTSRVFNGTLRGEQIADVSKKIAGDFRLTRNLKKQYGPDEAFGKFMEYVKERRGKK
jgi:hypothetical protein